MKVHEFDENYKVYFTALDRLVKQIDEDVYEAYHITVAEDENTLSISTIDLRELTIEDINSRLGDCGLKYNDELGQIVQKHNETDVVESDETKLKYVLADRISISRLTNESFKYEFANAQELNELMLEHDIPVKFTTSHLDMI